MPFSYYILPVEYHSFNRFFYYLLLQTIVLNKHDIRTYLNLGGFALILYVDMDWLMVIGIEEKTYPEDKKDCWHIFKIYAKV